MHVVHSPVINTINFFNGASPIQSNFQIYENGRLVEDVMRAAISHLDVSQFEGPPCDDRLCLNGGVCVTELNVEVSVRSWFRWRQMRGR